MDTRTGKIYEIDTEEAAKLHEKELRGKLTMLSPEEYQQMKGLKEELRPVELALMRFVAKRVELKAPHGPEVKNAFRLGYEAALKDQRRE